MRQRSYWVEKTSGSLPARVYVVTVGVNYQEFERLNELMGRPCRRKFKRKVLEQIADGSCRWAWPNISVDNLDPADGARIAAVELMILWRNIENGWEDDGGPVHNPQRVQTMNYDDI